MQTITIVGIIASLLTATASIPQLVKIVKNKEAKDISLLMVSILVFGLAAWIIYGVLKKDIIIIIANAIPCLVNILIGVMKVYYSEK